MGVAEERPLFRHIADRSHERAEDLRARGSFRREHAAFAARAEPEAPDSRAVAEDAVPLAIPLARPHGLRLAELEIRPAHILQQELPATPGMAIVAGARPFYDQL